MSLQHVPNLPFPHGFKTLAEAEVYIKQLRASIYDWAATLPERVTIATMGMTGLSDPNDDRIVFWDDSAGRLAWLDMGDSVAISTTTLDTIQDIRTSAGPTFDHVHLTDELFLADTAHAEIGVIYKGADRFLHNYHGTNADGYNFFAGVNSGNFTSDGDADSQKGSYNAAIGYSTLSALTLGKYNMAMGACALQDLTSGYQNVGIGAFSGTDLTTGHSNTFVGSRSGFVATTGAANVGIGEYSLGHLTTSWSNNFVGYYSGSALATGNNNNGIGYEVLNALQGGSGNVAMGTQAGYSLNASYCVFIGEKAGYYETGDYKLFIDDRQRASEADGRAKALIYGIFADATANQYLNVNGHLNALEDISVAGTRVVGAQGAHIADASGGDIIDSEARTAINAVIAALETHGLLAAA